MNQEFKEVESETEENVELVDGDYSEPLVYIVRKLLSHPSSLNTHKDIQFPRPRVLMKTMDFTIIKHPKLI